MWLKGGFKLIFGTFESQGHPFPEISRGFYVWFFWWSFWWIPWKNKQEKIRRKIRLKKFHDFHLNFLTKIHSGKILP